MSRKRSKKGFWGFLRPQKTPGPEAETSEVAGALGGEQDAPQTPKEDSFDALFAYLDEERRDAELESSTGPPEALEQTKDRESHSSAWEISEEKETQETEASERESPEKAEVREPEQSVLESGNTVEELRILEEQVASLESCIVKRLSPRR